MTTLTQSDLDDIRRTQLLRKEHAKQSSMDYAEGVQCLIDCDMLLSHIAELAAENARRKTKKRQFPSLCSPEQNAESLLQYYAKQGVGDMALLQALDGPQWSELTCALLRARAILSAASALEQKEQE